MAVTAWMTSVPDEVTKVKVLEVVALPPGGTDTDGVSVPTPRVTPTDPGDIGPSSTPSL